MGYLAFTIRQPRDCSFVDQISYPPRALITRGGVIHEKGNIICDTLGGGHYAADFLATDEPTNKRTDIHHHCVKPPCGGDLTSSTKHDDLAAA